MFTTCWRRWAPDDLLLIRYTSRMCRVCSVCGSTPESTAAAIIGPSFRDTHRVFGSRMFSVWEVLINCRCVDGVKMEIVAYADWYV
jgi:hypothetical protein